MSWKESKTGGKDEVKSTTTRRRKRHKHKLQKSSEEIYTSATSKLTLAITAQSKDEVPKVAVPVAVIQYFLEEAKSILQHKTSNQLNTSNELNSSLGKTDNNSNNNNNNNNTSQVESILFGNTARSRLSASSSFISSTNQNSERWSLSVSEEAKVQQERRQQQSFIDTAIDNTNEENSSVHLMVEVETTQGYVYTGELVHIDAFYNLSLRNAQVRRERVCDVERFLLHQRYISLYAPLNAILHNPATTATSSSLPSLSSRSTLSGANDLLLNSYAERANSATRPRHVGSVLIRSNNLYMIRFLSEKYNEPVNITASVATTEIGNSNVKHNNDISNSTIVTKPPSTLNSFFKLAANLARKHVSDEKRRDREARRRRLAAIQSANKR